MSFRFHVVKSLFHDVKCVFHDVESAFHDVEHIFQLTDCSLFQGKSQFVY